MWLFGLVDGSVFFFFFFFNFNFLNNVNIVVCYRLLAAKKSERGNIVVKMWISLIFFIFLLIKQRVRIYSVLYSLGMLLLEGLNCRILFEQPWNYCKFGLPLRLKVLLDWWSLLLLSLVPKCEGKGKKNSEKIYFLIFMRENSKENKK